MTATTSHFTSLDLDIFDLAASVGETSVRLRLEAHAARCASCSARRTQRAALHERFRTTVFPRTREVVMARRASAARWARWRAWAALALPFGVSLVLLARGLEPRPRPVSPAPPQTEAPAPAVAGAIGVKGEHLLEVFARRGEPSQAGGPPVVRVWDGAQLAPGDALRFVLYPAGLPYALIASVDGAGQVSIYYPFEGEASAPIDAGHALSVPGSIVLDRAPGPERLFAIYSARPLEARAVREALARTAALGAPGIRAARRLPLSGTIQATLLFEKEAR